MDVDGLIRAAIREKRLIEFRLHGFQRIAEPHLYGIYKGARQLLVYQVGGASKSGHLPDWRRVDLAEMSGLRLLPETFEGPRMAPSRHVHWDIVLAQVE